MPPELVKELVATYGLPVGFACWLAYNAWIGKTKVDPSKEILSNLHDLRDRMTRVETILEERK